MNGPPDPCPAKAKGRATVRSRGHDARGNAADVCDGQTVANGKVAKCGIPARRGRPVFAARDCGDHVGGGFPLYPVRPTAQRADGRSRAVADAATASGNPRPRRRPASGAIPVQKTCPRDAWLRAKSAVVGTFCATTAGGCFLMGAVQTGQDVRDGNYKMALVGGVMTAAGAGSVVAEMRVLGRIVVASNAGGSTLPMSLVRVVARGEKVDDLINEVKVLTYQTGNEHALVTLANGERAIVAGGPGGIRFDEGQITTLFGHTHPTSAPPRRDDSVALRRSGQSQQTVLHGGQETKVRRGD